VITVRCNLINVLFSNLPSNLPRFNSCELINSNPGLEPPVVPEPLPHVPVGRSSRQNVRLYRSLIVVSSASFSEEFVLLTESLHHSNSFVEFIYSVSLVTNATPRHETMTTKVSIIFTNSPQQAASNYTIERQYLCVNYR